MPVVFCLSLLGTQVLLAYGFLDQGLSLFSSISAHFVCLGLAGVFLKKERKMPPRMKILCLITVCLTAVSGPLGAFTGLSILFLQLYEKAQPSGLPKELKGQNIPYPEFNEEAEELALLQAKEIETKASVVPFKDILLGGKTEEKIELLTALEETYRPEFAPTLLRAKKDPQEIIRALSASIISKIDQRFRVQGKALQAKLHQDPENPLALLNLAHHSREYANCGLLDPYRERHIRTKAIDLFHLYLKGCPGDVQNHIEVAKLYLKSQNPQKTLDIFENLRLHHFDLKATDLFWYLNALYDLGLYKQLREKIVSLAPLKEPRQAKSLSLFKNHLASWRQETSLKEGASP